MLVREYWMSWFDEDYVYVVRVTGLGWIVKRAHRKNKKWKSPRRSLNS